MKKFLRYIIFFLLLISTNFISSCTTSLPSLNDVENPKIGVGPLALKESTFGNYKNKLEKRNEKIVKSTQYYFILEGKDDVNFYIFDYVESEKNILITCPAEKFNKTSENIIDIFNFVADNNELLGHVLLDRFAKEYDTKAAGNIRLFDDLFIDYKVNNGLLYITFYNPKDTSNLIITDTESKLTLNLPRSFSDIFTYKVIENKDDVYSARGIQLDYSPSSSIDINLITLQYANVQYKEYLLSYYDGTALSQKNDHFLFLTLQSDLKALAEENNIQLQPKDLEYYNTIVMPDLIKFENYIKWSEKKE